MRILVCGGRDYADRDCLCYVLNLTLGELGAFTVVQGDCRGADRMAGDWAIKHGMKVEVYPANWDVHGKAAGFIRNKEMVEVADRVIAFWDGQSKGTAHTIELAQSRNIPVYVVKYKQGKKAVV